MDKESYIENASHIYFTIRNVYYSVKDIKETFDIEFKDVSNQYQLAIRAYIEATLSSENLNFCDLCRLPVYELDPNHSIYHDLIDEIHKAARKINNKYFFNHEYRYRDKNNIDRFIAIEIDQENPVLIEDDIKPFYEDSYDSIDIYMYDIDDNQYKAILSFHNSEYQLTYKDSPELYFPSKSLKKIIKTFNYNYQTFFK